ncbi:HNH endonuclease [Bacillus cereus]|uniref:AP2/ERF domain-containing protein n=1 Tax=Bacillus cereus TaxID=1396 RepID=A0A9X8IY66_BACCE|nr:HNH endonuclease [Bacillus cereus]RWQ72537.1 hypothetical protein DR116_0018355 [Bacillus cereus]
MVKEIPLYGKNGEGKFALVDDDDYEKLSKHRWFANNHGYALRTYMESRRQYKAFMHREIIDVPADMVTDHINRDKLDNRKSNLRIATRAQNNYNVPTRQKQTTSIYKGVTWSNRDQKWQSSIVMNGKKNHLGYFSDETFAARVYDYFAYKMYGEFAYLNFPDKLLGSYEKPLLRSSNSSGHEGISWCKDREKWAAYIRKDGKRIFIGRFKEKQEAIDAYERKQHELFNDGGQAYGKC